MAYKMMSNFIYDCSVCHTRCDGISKGSYIFDNDVSFSEAFEEKLINRINRTGNFTASKSNEKGYPDLEILDKTGKHYCFVEVKVQQRTFMHVKKYLPESSLEPSETVALNLSDLLRYFDIEKTLKKPVIIAWFLLNRNCIVDQNNFKVYFQSCEKLEKIYKAEKSRRLFKRKSGDGDVVNGVHKGVTINYHFSLKELKEWTW